MDTEVNQVPQINNRDLLDLSVGKIQLEEVRGIEGCDFIDKLPKDIIQYLQSYTIPEDCYIVRERVWNPYGKYYAYYYYAWTDKTKEEVFNIARTKHILSPWADRDNLNNYIQEAKLLYIDGMAYVGIQVPKRCVFVPKPPKSTIAISQNKKAKRCKGMTKTSRRCKHRTLSESQLCEVHNASK